MIKKKEERRKDDNPMKRNKIVYSFLILAVILVFAVGPKVASAIPLPLISGTISIGGVVTPIDSVGDAVGDYTLATGLKFGAPSSGDNFVNVTPLGSYFDAGFARFDFVTLTTFQFSPGGSVLVKPLWEIDSGGASFILTNVSIAQPPLTNFLNLSGSGIAKLDGFADTPGSWSFTGLSGGGAFSFTSITHTPEPGTVILLGIGLAGLVGVGVRRKMKMRKQTG